MKKDSEILEIKNLFAGYEELEVLKGIDIEVREKEIVALVGPNGAGKSTVINSVFNIADVFSGEIKLDKKNLRGLKTHDLLEEGVSYVNQGRIIFGNLSVRENLEIGGDLLGKEEVSKRIEEIYKKFPVLHERREKLAFGLSGGERQMLALGRAMMGKPKLLMLDEPSLGLSPKLQIEIFGIIKKLRDDGISMLIVEQNAKRAIELADRTYLLEDGKVAFSGGREILERKEIKNVYLGGRY